MTDARDQREPDTAWLDDIKDDLKVEPSPAFATRVRAAVEAEGEPGANRSWFRWTWMGVTFAGAAAVAIAMVMSRPAPGTNLAAPSAAPRQAAVVPKPTPVPPAVADVPPPTVTRVPSPVAAPATPTTPSSAVPRQQVSVPVAATARLDLTVQTDQPDVIRRVWQGVARTGVDPIAADLKFREALVASTAPPVEVSELVVEPISVKPLELPDAAAGRAGGQRLIAVETTRSR